MNGPLTSPWSLDLSDPTGTLAVRVSFNVSTLALQSVTVTRSAGYQYGTLLLNGTMRIAIPAGTTTISKGQLNSVGLSSLTDIASYTLEP